MLTICFSSYCMSCPHQYCVLCAKVSTPNGLYVCWAKDPVQMLSHYALSCWVLQSEMFLLGYVSKYTVKDCHGHKYIYFDIYLHVGVFAVRVTINCIVLAHIKNTGVYWWYQSKNRCRLLPEILKWEWNKNHVVLYSPRRR